jgi:primosomal replication protein N''
LPDMTFYRLCPNCGSKRSITETVCENTVEGRICAWSLTDVEISEEGAQGPAPAPNPDPRPTGQRCVNGHPMEAGDEICLQCGADVARQPPRGTAPREPTRIGDWELIREHASQSEDPAFRTFDARGANGREALLTLYRPSAEPDTAVHDVLRRMALDHTPELIDTGRYDGRAYEVTERIGGGTLADVGYAITATTEGIRRVVDELGRALASFAEVGLRHRDLNPRTILLRSVDPLDLVIAGFGSARLSDFDLEAVAPLELTPYSAPEAIVGAVSASSDWWSLGMIVLEQVTAGRCFEGINEQAFRLHVVTRGVSLPEDLDSDIELLLRGLLSRDPLKRWSAPEVRAWLAGDSVEAPEKEPSPGDAKGPKLSLAGRGYSRPDAFALAAAEAGSWEEARELVLRGAVATWLEEGKADPKLVAEVRRLAADETSGEDFRHALVLMAMNSALPLILKGEIVTPAWLLTHPVDGYSILTGDVTRHLERMGREPWLVRLRTRAQNVRDRAKLLEIELDEERTRIALLATSRANLEAERDTIRKIYPDSDHSGLASIVERGRLSDEDLIILVGAASHQYIALASLMTATSELARQTGVVIDEQASQDLLRESRRGIFAKVDERIANFARCGVQRVDEWADSFRVERRIPLPRAAVLLAVPAGQWKEPPRQQYVATLLSHFEKRVSGIVTRGPLARFTIGKTTPRLDLLELGTALKPADAMLNHVLARTEVPIPLDPQAYRADENRESRLRRLVSHASTFRRDTGLDGRTLGFPFLVVRDGRATTEIEARPRIAPVLLWPVILEIQTGGQGATLAFDREREEVRLNPALEGIVGPQAFQKWQSARDELLGRSAIKTADVIDVFGDLATPRSRTMTRLPSKDAKVPAGTFELVAAAALFNAEFTGQSVAEDLRQMANRPPAGTGLDAALRIEVTPLSDPPLSESPERERFIVVESDPSQEAAVLRSRTPPGLLVEGPPGTGKSQTIVNVIADAIGRGESVLVVCQKQAALQVVRKRMEAEELGERLFMVVDINRDRETILRELRDQLTAVRESPPGRVAALRRQRDENAARIGSLERDLDRHHQVSRVVDDATGLSYRELLSELISVEESGKFIEAPILRSVVGKIDGRTLSSIEEACSSLSGLWLDAAYEDSALVALQPFPVDTFVARAINEEFQQLIDAEDQRQAVLSVHADGFDISDPAGHSAWLQAHGAMLEGLSEAMRTGVAAWLDLFRPARGAEPGTKAIAELEAIEAEIMVTDPEDHDASLSEAMVTQTPTLLRGLVKDAQFAGRRVSFFGRLNPRRWRARRRLAKFLDGQGEPADDIRMLALGRAARLELQLRTLRQRVVGVRETLRLAKHDMPLLLADLGKDVQALLGFLRPVSAACLAVFNCPQPTEAEAAARSASEDAFRALRKRFEAAFARYEARQQSHRALQTLLGWFTDEWTGGIRTAIDRNGENSPALSKIADAIDTLEAFQRFRARATRLEPEALQIFRILRRQDAHLRAVERSELEGVVRRTIRREALLSWKGRLESAAPELSFEREEIEAKVGKLTLLDRTMRQANKELLRYDIDPGRLGNPMAWDDITRLRGPRARRLREIIDQGADLGLMRLRPVWLMNPDVASRILPLKAGLFDLVIYDEASQMPVEHAVPTLFRGKRILVVGDEKQMPPSSFFSGRIDGDEEETGEESFDDGVTEAERSAREETWNRREVKDCPDLLQLGRSVLPKATLQIHYRSKYRELIGYSNSAFYKGALSVPARHPEAEVRRARPVEVIRVDGLYENQTNRIEAQRVVDWLARVWSETSAPPSIGVVTFNRKQADIVEELVEKRAEADEAFLRVYRRERDRKQAGEDMGFFIKNVENVQGDERDVIVFSTTFGRDRHGTFRRNFGVLGQAGGERRLNVAVTRAREKVVLVTSMPLGDVSDWLASGRMPDKPRDYLQAYLDYAQRMSAGDVAAAQGTVDRMLARTTGRARTKHAVDDGFVQSVASFVGSLGYSPVPAAEGDAFGIDFAVEDARTGLFGIGIECDAPRHELLERARAREIWRPAVLRRAIPAIHRVSSYAWYHRPEEERNRLNMALRAALS